MRSRLPSSGGVTVSGSSQSLMVSFYNFSITADKVGKLSSYLRPDSNYSGIDVTSMTVINESSMRMLNSSGTEVVTNVSYDYTFNSTYSNTTNNYFIKDRLALQNVTSQTTSKIFVSSYKNYTLTAGTNVTNITVYITNNTYENSNLALLSSSQNRYLENASFFEIGGMVNETLSFNIPNGTGAGSLNFNDPPGNSTANVTSGYFTGVMVNGSDPMNYTLSITNNNATVNVSGDPMVIPDGISVSSKTLGTSGFATLITITDNFGLTKQEFAANAAVITATVAILLVINSQVSVSLGVIGVFAMIGYSISFSNPFVLAIIGLITGALA